MPTPDRAEAMLDDLFNALDGRTLTVGDRSWRLHLYSARELDNSVWIQLDVVGSPTYVLTICQPVTTDSTAVLAVLSRYLEVAKDESDSVVFDRIMERSPVPVSARNPVAFVINN